MQSKPTVYFDELFMQASFRIQVLSKEKKNKWS